MVDLIELLKQLDNPVLYETGGNREYISSNIFELTGYYAEEMRLNRDLFPGLINPEDYIETNFRIKTWHKNNEPGVLTLQFRFQSANGTQLWIEDHLIGLTRDNIKFMQGMMVNISATKNRETKLLQLRTEWREKNIPDEREREVVYADIQRQLDELNEDTRIRKERISHILNHTKTNHLSFEKLNIY